MSLMKFRKRANSVRGEEFVFIEDVAVNALELLPVGDGRAATAILYRRLLAHVHVLATRRGLCSRNHCMRLTEPGKPRQILRLEGLHGKKRNQPDHGPHAAWEWCVVSRRCKHVVVEAVLLVPQADPFAAHIVHRLRNINEVLEEFAGHVFVGGSSCASSMAIDSMSRQIHGHPAGAIGLFDEIAGPERRRAVKYADVIQSEKATLKNVLALRVLAIHPPRKIQQQACETPARENCGLACPGRAPRFYKRATPPRRARADSRLKNSIRRRAIARWDACTIRAGKESAAPSRIGINQRHRHAVKSQIPRGVPRIFPLVRHGNDVGVVKVRPIVISPVARALRIGLRLRGVALEPAREHHSDSFACPRAVPRTPAAAPGAHRRLIAGTCAARRIRPLLSAGSSNTRQTTGRRTSVTETLRLPRDCDPGQAAAKRPSFAPARFRARKCAAAFVPFLAGFTASALAVQW